MTCASLSMIRRPSRMSALRAIAAPRYRETPFPARAAPGTSGRGRRTLGPFAVAGMAGVVGWDHGPFAVAVDEGPAVVGLEPVVVGAGPVEPVEHRQMGGRPVLAVVVLQICGPRAAFGRTRRVEPFQRAL